ncbi:MAG TPA: ATP-binding protein [Anaerolineaceae bacterium]|nr:ATP-binding protein [Anaerolineaceae bacterium]HPN54238.1 ATP-binding protein [Anaerolineaceae bacterium]
MTDPITAYINQKMQRKLMVMAVLLVLAVMGGIGTYWVYTENRKENTALETKAQMMVQLLSRSLSKPMWNLDRNQMQSEVDAIMVDKEVASILVFDTFHEAPVASAVRTGNVAQPVFYEKEIFYSSVYGTEIIGKIQIIYTRELVIWKTWQNALFILTLVVTLVVSLTLGLYFFVGKIVANPLRHLTTSMGGLVESSYNVTVDVNSTDEIGQMAEVFNRMAERLRTSFEAIHTSEMRYRNLVNLLPIGVNEMDLDGRLRFSNLTHDRIFDAAEGGLMGKCFFDLLGDAAKERDIYRRQAEAGQTPVPPRDVTLRQNGEIKIIQIISDIRRDAQGKAVGWVNLVSDVTRHNLEEAELLEYRLHLEDLVTERTAELEKSRVELMAARDAAEAASRAKSTFLASMSHEIRTPFNAILGFAQLMQRDPDVTAQQAHDLDVITQSVEHLLSIINDILDMAKIESGRIVINSEDFDLYEMLDGIDNLFSLRVIKKGLSLNFEKNEGIPRYLHGDQGKLRQVLVNLLGNSVKFTDEGGIALRVSAQPVEGKIHLHFEVEDTGRGIPLEMQDRIFEPFEQGMRVQGSKEDGTGLGLPISRQYARMMDGDIKVTSQPGHGSLFHFDCIMLPAVQPEGQLNQTFQKRVKCLAPGQREYRILVVDDRQTNRELLSRLLMRAGFITREAENGLQAVEALSGWQPDLIFMDMIMPEMNGMDATRSIHAQAGNAGLPIVIVSATVMESHRIEALANGANGFIRKPFLEREIFNEIKRLLGVEYIYEYEEETGVSAAAVHQANAEMIKMIPPETLQNMLEAVQIGEMNRLQNLIDEIEEKCPVPASQLRLLANAYEYDQLHSLLFEAMSDHNLSDQNS